MRTSLWIASALCTVGLSAPTLPPSAAPPGDMTVLSDYFNLLASKVDASRSLSSAPVCDLSQASMPVAPTPLPGVSAGLALKHVAIGRGTQNYTCDLTNSTAVPVAIGAIATLYNATCVAATYPDILAVLPNTTLQFNPTAQSQSLYPSNLIISGHHYFQNTTTPTFNLDTTNYELGFAPTAKNNTTPAPANAPKGQNGVGNGAVAWLKLLTRDGATGDLQEIYRVNTAGGNPPATCVGSPAAFEVQYAAEYWFWEN